MGAGAAGGVPGAGAGAAAANAAGAAGAAAGGAAAGGAAGAGAGAAAGAGAGAAAGGAGAGAAAGGAGAGAVAGGAAGAGAGAAAANAAGAAGGAAGAGANAAAGGGATAANAADAADGGAGAAGAAAGGAGAGAVDGAGTGAAAANAAGAAGGVGTVVRLDRGFPLVRLDGGGDVRCEHAASLEKRGQVRAVIGDRVRLELPDGHDKGVIAEILPRRTKFVRRDPAERTAGQVLAANFDLVVIAEPIVELNRKRLERELVLAHETGAHVAIVLTKGDLDESGGAVEREVCELAGAAVDVLVTSISDPRSVEQVRALVPGGVTAILIGKSGVGKSSLVNALAGRDVQETAAVRAGDGKGRHTTVERVMVEVPGGGAVVDMPGVRGLGMWDADQGLEAAFPDVEELAQSCRFRDCAHGDEPGCAVRAAAEAGTLAAARVESYRSLAAEIAQTRERRAEAARLRGRKRK